MLGHVAAKYRARGRWRSALRWECVQKACAIAESDRGRSTFAGGNSVGQKPTNVAAGREERMKSDRTTLSSTQLYQLATQGRVVLSPAERNRLSADYLFVLAVTNKLTLDEHDKDRLRPVHLAHLAVAEKIELSQHDKDRLPTDLLFELFVAGYASLSDEEMARFSDQQADELRHLEAAHSGSLCAV
jgi:hypothetical protein